jgi:adenylate cyclase
MNASHPRRHLTLFATVLSLFLAVALMVGTAVTVANYFETQRTAIKVAADTFQSTISRINEQRIAFFPGIFADHRSAQRTHASSVRWTEGRNSAVGPGHLKGNPQISAAYVGYENGNFFHVLSITDAETLTRFAIQEVHSDDSDARTQTWLFFDSDTREIATLRRQSPPYDPRSRGWYRDAIEHPNDVIRTLPHLFTATSQVGMTLAQTLEKSGVVGVDIAIDRCSAKRYNESRPPPVLQARYRGCHPESFRLFACSQ